MRASYSERACDRYRGNRLIATSEYVNDGECLDLFKAPAGGYTNLGFLSGFFLIVLLQGWAFWLITKVNSFKSA